MVSRRGRAGIFLTGCENAAIRFCDVLEDLPGAVARAVIDHDRLPVRPRLGLQAGKTFGKRVVRIMRRDEERDVGRRSCHHARIFHRRRT